MKIAFVGKGGSGKSTLSALFIKYLELRRSRQVLAVDADINMNLAGLLGIESDRRKQLARPEVSERLRTFLKGTNDRIEDVSKFLPTTPPGRGSCLIDSFDHTELTHYSTRVSDESKVRLVTVGTYDSDGIGQTCYHSHLFTVENLLSHLITNEDFTVVCDMVAGTDAFAYSMHLQFDAIVLIAEPTPESVEVCGLFNGLAKEAGIEQLVWLVGNKVEDEDDLGFITSGVGMSPIAFLPSITVLKKARQSGLPVDETLLLPSILDALEVVERKVSTRRIPVAQRYRLLHRLHEKLTEKQWVQQGYGDVLGQLDPDFYLLKEKELV